MSSSIQSQAASTNIPATAASNTTEVTRVLVAKRFENGALSCRIVNRTMLEGTIMTPPANGQETIICVTHDNHSNVLKATGHSYDKDTGRSENFEPGINLAHFDDQGRLTRLMLLDQPNEDPNPRRHCVDPTHNTFIRCENAFVAVEPIQDAEINRWWIPRRVSSEAEDGPIPPWVIPDPGTTADQPDSGAAE